MRSRPKGFFATSILSSRSTRQELSHGAVRRRGKSRYCLSAVMQEVNILRGEHIGQVSVSLDSHYVNFIIEYKNKFIKFIFEIVRVII